MAWFSFRHKKTSNKYWFLNYGGEAALQTPVFYDSMLNQKQYYINTLQHTNP